MKRFETYAENYYYDNKFQVALTREQAADMMNDLAEELAMKIKQLEQMEDEK
jgi:hypothetical protein